jgi:methionine aminopeptidase
MSITKPEELEGLQEAAAVVRLVLDAMKSRVQPGITTAELDSIGANVMRSNHAESAPAKVYGFPGSCCISVNDEAVHDGWTIRTADRSPSAHYEHTIVVTQSRPLVLTAT